MNRYLLITFPNESAAYDGTRALRDLHAEGDISLYGQAVFSVDADGNISVKDVDDPGPVGTAVGALTGGLVGLLGGPAGFVLGAAGGTLVGSISDLYNAGVGADFADEVSAQVKPGSAAIVAEVSEEWILPVETRMEALGGTVLRKARIDVEDEQLDRDLQAWQQEWDELDAEIVQADAEARAKIEAKKVELKGKIDAANQKVSAKIDATKTEAQAKLDALRQQVTAAKDKAHAAIEKRLAAIQADRDARLQKLQAAQNLTAEALKP